MNTIMSDLGKHKETVVLTNFAMTPELIQLMVWPREDKVHRFIEDFE